jgi:predicted PhzF superfamily epimerase YddE/YHI9
MNEVTVYEYDAFLGTKEDPVTGTASGIGELTGRLNSGWI